MPAIFYLDDPADYADFSLEYAKSQNLFYRVYKKVAKILSPIKFQIAESIKIFCASKNFPQIPLMFMDILFLADPADYADFL